jgi:hypothetical protein
LFFFLLLRNGSFTTATATATATPEWRSFIGKPGIDVRASLLFVVVVQLL